MEGSRRLPVALNSSHEPYPDRNRHIGHRRRSAVAMDRPDPAVSSAGRYRDRSAGIQVLLSDREHAVGQLGRVADSVVVPALTTPSAHRCFSSVARSAGCHVSPAPSGNPLRSHRYACAQADAMRNLDQRIQRDRSQHVKQKSTDRRKRRPTFASKQARACGSRSI